MASATAVDSAFRALADPTRRQLLERLCEGPATMTELSRPFAMTLPSLSKHLRILEDGGLVRSSKHGRVRTYQLVPRGLDAAEGWLARQRRLWVRRLDQLDTHLQTLKDARS